MREGMPLIFGWKVDFAKHPNVHPQILIHMFLLLILVSYVSPTNFAHISLQTSSDIPSPLPRKLCRWTEIQNLEQSEATVKDKGWSVAVRVSKSRELKLSPRRLGLKSSIRWKLKNCDFPAEPFIWSQERRDNLIPSTNFSKAFDGRHSVRMNLGICPGASPKFWRPVGSIYFFFVNTLRKLICHM